MNIEKSSALLVIDIQQEDFMEMNESNAGSNRSKIVFDHSCWKPDVTSGVLREECLAVLKDYFGRKAE